MKSEKGASMVEFALVLPILILLVFGIVDFGRVFHAYLTIDHVGREMARFGSVNQITELDLKKKTEDMIEEYLDKKPKEVDVTRPSTRGENVIIEIKYDLELLTPVLKPFLNSFPLEDTTTMRVE